MTQSGLDFTHHFFEKLCQRPFQVYLGGHEHFGEDGIELIAEKAIGRDDYGKPQCIIKNRNEIRGCEQPPVGSRRQPRAGHDAVPPTSIWHALFGRRFLQKRAGRAHRRFPYPLFSHR